MKYGRHTGKTGPVPAHILGGARLAVCLLLLCPGAALAGQATAQPAKQAPAKTPTAQPPRPVARRPVVPAVAAPRTPRPAPAAPTAPAAPAQATPAGRPALAPMPPREVVTVVHRLSGWKLLAWLAANGPPALELDDLPSPGDAHTNIVAGYVHEDGRSIVARLPQPGVELEGMPTPPAALTFFAQAGEARKAEPEYSLVTTDGKRLEAKFVGLDAATGLTLLEASEPILSGSPRGEQGDTDDPTVGQRVRLYAPALATPAPAGAQARTDAGFIYLSIEQKEGLLTRVRRGSSGKPFSVVASAEVSPEWVGAVAANELGEVVGIVSQSGRGEAQIVPLAAVRSACERVLKLRGSAPQPWLGVRGDAAFQAPLKTWIDFGWSPELARPHIENRRGVFLTSVAPGTPAALAGLRPGDLIASVGTRELRSVEDLSLTLREAGVGSVVDVTVWRSPEPRPFRLPVELKGTNNPALATAFAEQRAAYESFSAVAREMSAVEAELQTLAAAGDSPAARAKAESVSGRLRELKVKFRAGSEEMKAAEARVAAARSRASDRPAFWPAPTTRFELMTPPQPLGLSAIGLTPRGAARLGAQGGMLVLVVRPGTPAAATLRAGDVIETINSTPARHEELKRLLADPDAAPLTLGLVREGRRLTVNFTPSAPPR